MQSTLKSAVNLYLLIFWHPVPTCPAYYGSQGQVTVKFTPEQAMKSHAGSRGITLLFLFLSAKWGWVVNITPWLLYSQEGNLVPIVQAAV